MTLRRLASLVARARVPSVSSGLELNSSLVPTAWSPCAVSTPSRAASTLPRIYNHIHGSGCRCGGCSRWTTYNLVGRFSSGSSSGLAPPEAGQTVAKSVDSGAGHADGAGQIDTSFIHPTEAAQHHGQGQNHSEDGSYWLMQPVYDSEYLEVVKPSLRKPSSFMDWTGYSAVWVMRRAFDLVTGYGPNMTHQKWMTRFLFLESVAGVPGMVGAMHRHLRSLRDMRRDGGRIHTLLEESENERMHLLTFLQLKQPSMLFRFNVIATQGVFLALYSLFYAISERHCHAFVEYLETEAVKTYTHAISDLDQGRIPEWKDLAAPVIAKKYWRLKEGATFRDVLLNVRADEACHQHVNGAFATMGIWDTNPFAPGTTQHMAADP